MRDRVPLADTIKKVVEPEEPSIPPRDENGEGVPKDDFLAQHQDKRVLSAVLGFDEPSFDDMGRYIDEVYSWAREQTGKPSGDEIINAITELKKNFGNTTGKPLLNKMYRWVVFDRQQKEIEQQKRNLE